MRLPFFFRLIIVLALTTVVFSLGVVALGQTVPPVPSSLLSYAVERESYFRASFDADYLLYTVDLRTGSQISQPLTQPAYSCEWSADGTRLAVPTREYLVLYDDQLNTVARVATNGAFSNDEQLTAWSPDGQRLAFLQREGDGGHHLWLTDRKAVDFERLTTVPRFATGVSWSPDGTRLALTGAAGEIWLLDLEDGSERLLADQVYPGISPAWSPDGRYMLYTTTMNADSYYKTLVLLDLAAPDTEPERLSAVAHSWAELVWLADRDRVVYQTSPATINMLDPIADDGYPWLTVRGQVHEVAASTDGRVAVHILERQTGPHIVISGMTHRVMPSKREQITALCWR